MTYQNDDVLDWWDDADEHPADQVEDFSPIPPGTYRAQISEIEVEEFDTDRAYGRRIKMQLSITGPTHEGRLVWHRFNTDYQPKAKDQASAEKAQKTRAIARAEFGVVARASGFTGRPRAIHDLIGKEVGIKIAHREWDGKIYEDIKKFEALDGAPQRPSSSAPAAAAKSARPANLEKSLW